MEAPLIPARNTSTQIPTTPTPGDGMANTHVVQDGETLHSIANQYGTNVDTIRNINPQIRDNGRLPTGDTINLPNLGTILTGSPRNPSSTPMPSMMPSERFTPNAPMTSGTGMTQTPSSVPGTMPPGMAPPSHFTSPPTAAPQSSQLPLGLSTAQIVDIPLVANLGRVIGLPQLDPPRVSADIPNVDTYVPVDAHSGGNISTPPPRVDNPTVLPPPRDPVTDPRTPPANGASTQPTPTQTTPQAPQQPVDNKAAALPLPTDRILQPPDKSAQTTLAQNALTRGAANALRGDTAAMLANTTLAATLVALPTNAAEGEEVVTYLRQPFNPAQTLNAKEAQPGTTTADHELPKPTGSDARTAQEARVGQDARAAAENAARDPSRLLRDVQARMLSDPRLPGEASTRAQTNDPSTLKGSEKNAAANAAALGLQDEAIKTPAMADREARLSRRSGDAPWMFDWVGQLAEIRRAYAKARREEGSDLLTTVATIGIGVAMLAGAFALYALYKYWAPH